MSDFLAADTLETIAALAGDLDRAAADLIQSLNVLRTSSSETEVSVTPQAFVEQVLALDEQISRTRLLLPLCTAGVAIREEGRSLALSDLIVETRSEFDALARAQLEALIESAPD